MADPVPYTQTPDWFRLAAIAINGLLSGQRNVSTKSAAYTITEGDNVILADATGGAFTVTLPPAAKFSGLQFIVKKTDASANVVTVDANGAETIDGAANVTLTVQYQSWTLFSNGTAWIVI